MRHTPEENAIEVGSAQEEDTQHPGENTLKYDSDPHEDIFCHLGICIRNLAKDYPVEQIYSIMMDIAKNKDRTRWNEPLIY